MAGMISLQLTSMFFNPWFISLHFKERETRGLKCRMLLMKSFKDLFSLNWLAPVFFILRHNLLGITRGETNIECMLLLAQGRKINYCIVNQDLLAWDPWTLKNLGISRHLIQNLGYSRILLL